MTNGLQSKKNKVRLELKNIGFLKRDGNNSYDNYRYFSEAQYKELFTRLFAESGVEMTASVETVEAFEGTAKQPYGRRVMMRFTLKDTESDQVEETVCFGEGLDKGDKAIYKAMTGALKYWLASNWMVATSDDPEREDNQSQSITPMPEQPQRKTTTPKKKGLPAQPQQIEILKQLKEKNPQRFQKMLEFFKVSSADSLSIEQASQAINQLNK